MDRYWTGTRLRLRAVEPEDASHRVDVTSYTHLQRGIDRIVLPLSFASARNWAEQATRDGANNDAFTFQMESLESGELVGGIHTHDCDRRSGTFRYGIYIHPDHERRGYASDAMRLVLRYYFDELRYQKCEVQIYDFNEGSIALHERFGFVPEGRLRRHAYTDGRFVDLLLFGMTDEEFRARHPDR